MVDAVDKEAACATGWIVNRVAEIRIGHRYHEGAYLLGRSELTVKSRLAQVSEEIFEDIALNVRPEPSEFDRIDFIDHLLEHIRIDDFENRVPEIFGDLRLLLHQ